MFRLSTARRREKIASIAELWNADTARLRLIWGGVAGAKMHGLLHGEDIVSAKTNRSSISHHRLRDDGFFCRSQPITGRFLK